jgi:hypothetical protein
MLCCIRGVLVSCRVLSSGYIYVARVLHPGSLRLPRTLYPDLEHLDRQLLRLLVPSPTESSWDGIPWELHNITDPEAYTVAIRSYQDAL